MAPEFSPDGKWISFLSDRGNKNQVHLMRIDGGEPKAVTREEEGVSFTNGILRVHKLFL